MNTSRIGSMLASMVALAALAACSGAQVAQGDAGAVSTPESGDSGVVSHPPKNHRPSPVACPLTQPQPSACADASTCDCTESSQCTTLVGNGQTPTPGRCLGASDAGATGTCNFDTCTTDDDCGATGTCSCYPSTNPSPGNTCIPGNCRVDGDCGQNGYCSPTVDPDCGSFYGTRGMYCHTAADECADDTDCVSDSGPGYCAYRKELGHWVCGYGFCAG